MSSATRFVPNYTVEDYRQWEGNWQLVEGVAISMSPSPFGAHERSVTEFVTSFNNQLRQQQSDCRTYAGLDWMVANDTVVRPEVMVVCGKQPERHLEKPPAIVVEVLSPSTRELDLVTKRRIYQEHGVQYYLIVDVEAKAIEVVRFGEDTTSETIGAGESAVLQVSENLQLALSAEQLFR